MGSFGSLRKWNVFLKVLLVHSLKVLHSCQLTIHDGLPIVKLKTCGKYGYHVATEVLQADSLFQARGSMVKVKVEGLTFCKVRLSQSTPVKNG